MSQSGSGLSSDGQRRRGFLLLGVRVVADGQWTSIPDDLRSGWEIVPPLDLRCETRLVVRPGAPQWHLSGDQLDLSLPNEFNDVAPSPLYPAAMFMAERTRQLHGHFLIHASAVAGRTGAIVLMGETGAGKTVAAIALAAEPERSLVSGDRTPVSIADGGLVTLGHFRPVRVRSSTIVALVRYASNRPLLPAELRDWAESNSQLWDAKRFVDGSYLGLRTSGHPQQIVAFVHVRVDNRLELQVQPIPSTDIRRHLHEEWLRPLAGRWVLIDNQQRLRLALRTAEPTVEEKRLLAVSIAGHIPAFRIRGPLRDVVAAVGELLD
jgi:hypothetical protein